MAFKYIQCRVCAATMSVNAFPEPHHRMIKKHGYGTCKRCDGMDYGSVLMSASISELHRFIKECEACL